MMPPTSIGTQPCGQPRLQSPLGSALITMLSALLISACATYSPPTTAPQAYLSRVITQSEGDVRVSAVVLTAEESQQVFGAPLEQEGIQPIWIEIDNQDDDEYGVMLLSIDRDYLSPAEAAWTTRRLGERGGDVKINYFMEQHLPVMIPPGTKASGFVYTHFDPGLKVFTVELVGTRGVRNFEFMQLLPGFEADFTKRDPKNLYTADEIEELDLDGLRAYLEALPCCVLGGDRKTPGDPLNLVVVGHGDDLLAAFVGQGWDLTETLRSDTALATAKSSLFGSEYRTSPVSPLYLYDRSQDVALQKTRQTVDERNHLRAWRAPVNFEGTPVWVGQISRDIGVKGSRRTLVTHKVDPIVDEARYYVMLDMMTSQHMWRAGYTKGVGYASRKEPRYNYTLDPYYTDGLRVVLFISDEPVAYDEIEWLDWETPPLEVD